MSSQASYLAPSLARAARTHPNASVGVIVRSSDGTLIAERALDRYGAASSSSIWSVGWPAGSARGTCPGSRRCPVS